MTRTPIAFACLLWLCLPALADEKPPQVKVEEIEVKGSVIDAQGKALAEIAVAEFWDYDGNWKPQGGVKSDAEGKFSLKLRTFPDQPGRGYRLQAGDENRGAIVVAKAATFKEPVELRLAPLCEVSAKVEGEDGFDVADGSYFNVSWRSPYSWICSATVKDKALKLKLPAGEYSSMLMAMEDFKIARKDFKVEGEKLELGTIKMQLTPVAKLYGKEPPAVKISAVRNLPKDLEEKGDKVTLADFRGRWVLIEFWGFW